jgi:hypothetical protein
MERAPHSIMFIPCSTRLTMCLQASSVLLLSFAPGWDALRKRNNYFCAAPRRDPIITQRYHEFASALSIHRSGDRRTATPINVRFTPALLP